MNEMTMPPSDYLLALLQELERLLPAPGSPDKNHAITWTRVAERDALVILCNVGDCLFPYTTTPDQIVADPFEQGVLPVTLHLVPTHVGHGSSGGGVDAAHGARE